MANLKLIGSKFIKITGERKPEFSGKLKMSTNVKIESMEKSKEAKDTVKIKYTFGIDYAELGEVSIKGFLFIGGDSRSIKDLLKVEKDKKYDSQEYLAITNLIIQKASIKAFELEEELGLPIHIKLPSLSLKK